MKMIEATNLKTIDDIINQVEKIEPKKEVVVQKTESPAKEIFVEKETQIEQINHFDLAAIDSIEIIDYSTPFDELPEEKNFIIEPIKELQLEPIFQEQVAVNVLEEIQIVPFEEELEEIVENNDLYEQLTAKVYDRDYALGECFEKNFIFKGFQNNKLEIISYAQDEDRKLLYKYFGIIKTFAQDIFGNDVELDFKKEEPSVLEKKNELKELLKIEEEVEESEQSSSMIEEIEIGSGCVADMTKSSLVTPSQQELQLNDILNSKMLDKVKELFDIKKITVKSRS